MSKVKHIKVYSTATCGFCHAEKEYLTAKGIAFEDVRVDQDQAKAEEMIELSGQMGVPFTVVEYEDGKSQGILGFDRHSLDAMIGIK